MNESITDIYREKYVAFLDVLGFKQFVEEADQDVAKRSVLLEVLALVRDSLCEDPSIGMRLTHFSDCIIISADRNPRGLWEMFKSIVVLTANLLQYDVFVRGGLAVGGAHHDDRFVYGTAINRAYLLEHNEARYPMTLLSSGVVDDAKVGGPPLEQWLQQDNSGRWFVHYLIDYAGYDPADRLPGTVIREMPARRIIDFVCHRLNIHSGTLLEKDQWFQAYWNNSVAVSGTFGRIEAGVTQRDETQVPTIIKRRIVSR